MANQFLLEVIIDGDSKDARVELKKFDKALDETGTGAKEARRETVNLSEGFRNLVTAGVITAAGRALFEFAKASVLAASDVEESLSKFNVVFAETAGTVTDELAAMADATSRSRFDLMEFAATFQDTFVPLGFAREEAAAMSTQLTQLAVDLASFNNVAEPDVVRDLQSALVGNTETLRKYGVVATQAAIVQKALELGLADSAKEMTAQDKAAAILAITLEGTADAQGDAERTAGSFANQSRALEAAIQDLKVSIGDDLLPIMQEWQETVIKGTKRIVDSRVANRRMNEALEAGLVPIREQREDFRKLRNGQISAAEVTAKYTALLKEQADAMAVFAGEAEAADRILLRDNRTIEQLTGSIGILNQVMGEQAFNLEDTADRVAFYAAVAKDAGQVTDDWEFSAEEMNDTLEEQKRAAEADTQALEELAAATNEHFFAALQQEAGVFDVNQALFELADTYNISAEQAALLGVATGQLTEEQAAQALEIAILQIELGNLLLAYKNNQLTADQAAEAARGLASGLFATADQAVTTISEIEALNAQFDAIPTDVSSNININVSGLSQLQQAQQIAQSLGGSRGPSAAELAEQAAVHGQRGADFVVPPGNPSDSFLVGTTSGERVTVQTRQQQRDGGMGGINIAEGAIQINQQPGQSANEVADAVMVAIARRSRQARSAGAGTTGNTVR